MAVVDYVGIVSLGCYSETYGSTELANLCNLYASLGYLEDAPNVSISITTIMDYYFRKREE